MALKTEGSQAELRRTIRVNKPLEKITNYLRTTDFSSWKEEHTDFIKKLETEPYETYKKLKDRLILQGQMASFPEFKGVVAILIEKLFQSQNIFEYYNSSKDKTVQLEVVIHKLIAILTKSRYYFPYVSSIYAIESMIILLDTYSRDTSTNKTIPNFYHNFRY